MYAGYLNLKDLQANQKIKEVVNKIQEYSDGLIKQPSNEVNQVDEELRDEELRLQLEALFAQHKEVDRIFQEASVSLDSEGFRAFSEVYKSAREIIERGIEDKQRRFSSYYVQELVKFLNSQEDPYQVSKQLEQKFVEITSRLLKDEIFSRESFVTFTEAYDIVRDTIERRKQ